MSQSQKKYFHNSWRFKKYCIFAAQFEKMLRDGENRVGSRLSAVPS